MAKRKPPVPGRGPGNPNFGSRANGTGRSGNPTGRPHGQIDKQIVAERLGIAPTEYDRYSPLVWAVALVNKDAHALRRMGTNPKNVDDDLRLRALTTIAPYLYSRMPQAVVSIDPLARRTVTEQQLAAMSPEQMNVLGAAANILRQCLDPNGQPLALPFAA